MSLTSIGRLVSSSLPDLFTTPPHLLPFCPMSQEGQLCSISQGMFNATNQQNGEEDEVGTLIPRLTLLGSKSSGVWVRTHLSSTRSSSRVLGSRTWVLGPHDTWSLDTCCCHPSRLTHSSEFSSILPSLLTSCNW